MLQGDIFMTLQIPVSWGELSDKMSILRIKMEKITDQSKLINIDHELTLLEQCRAKAEESDQLLQYERELKQVNQKLWEIEDDIRICEKNADFGLQFIELARAVYKTNDKRAGLKYKINMLLGSEIIEEKSYEDYSRDE